MLGRRAALAIAVGLLLQMMLIGHGGWTTLGVNTCVMTLPALLSWLLFQALHRIPWITHRAAGGLMVGASATVLYFQRGVQRDAGFNTPLDRLDFEALALANDRLFDPSVVVGAFFFYRRRRRRGEPTRETSRSSRSAS